MITINDDRVFPTPTGWRVPTESGDWFVEETAEGCVLRGPSGLWPDTYASPRDALAVPLGGQPT